MNGMHEILHHIQRDVREGSAFFTSHFYLEMVQDYLFFVDVETAIYECIEVSEIGVDSAGNLKYELKGRATDGRTIGLVCSVNDGVQFFTVYLVEH
jgi:hypothetical protein